MFEIESYFKKIGYQGQPKADLKTLTDLHELHTLSIPFENLSPFLYEEVNLSPEALSAKLVDQKRGGYCFEQNLLFAEVLKTLGFKVKGLGARVLWNSPEELITRRSHMLLAIELEGETFIADVGFGGLTLTTPLKFEPGLIQSTTHENFRIQPMEEDFKLEALVEGVWKTLYRFDLQTQYFEDYEVANFYLYTHPASPFRTALMAAKPTKDGRIALNNTKFSHYFKDGRVERIKLSTVEEVRLTLEEEFGLLIPLTSTLHSRLSSLFA